VPAMITAKPRGSSCQVFESGDAHVCAT
jgi:hypothetical protein